METQVATDFPHVIRPGTEPGVGPGIIVFHGWGYDEQVMLKRIRLLDERLTIVSLRGPIEAGKGFRWYGPQREIIHDRSTFDTLVHRLDSFFVTAPDRFQIDPKRLLIMGFSQGAVLATALTRMNAARFAGTISLSDTAMPIPLLHEAPNLIQGYPVFMAHGTHDTTIPLADGKMVRDKMTALGANVTFREYPYKHEFSAETVNDVNVWIRDVLGLEDS